MPCLSLLCVAIPFHSHFEFVAAYVAGGVRADRAVRCVGGNGFWCLDAAVE